MSWPSMPAPTGPSCAPRHVDLFQEASESHSACTEGWPALIRAGRCHAPVLWPAPMSCVFGRWHKRVHGGRDSVARMRKAHLGGSAAYVCRRMRMPLRERMRPQPPAASGAAHRSSMMSILSSIPTQGGRHCHSSHDHIMTTMIDDALKMPTCRCMPLVMHCRHDDWCQPQLMSLKQAQEGRTHLKLPRWRRWQRMECRVARRRVAVEDCGPSMRRWIPVASWRAC